MAHGWTRLLPNAVTFVRLALLPAFAWSLLDGRTLLAPALLVAIAGSDVLDGFLARRLGAGSRLGAFLDPLADKLTQLTGLVILAVGVRPGFTRIPPLFVAVVLARDLLLLYGAVRIRQHRGGVRIAARWEGKASTALVFALLLAACLGAPRWSVHGLALLAAPLVVAAGAHYTLDGLRQIRGGPRA